MPIDFDPVFHTETMVKILREQGSTQYAMELAELILQKNPEHGVRVVLAELKEEARKAFERFKNGGKPSESPEPESDSNEEELAAPDSEALEAPVPGLAASELPSSEDAGMGSEATVPVSPRLTLVEPPAPRADPSRKAKILRLQALLHRVQKMRRPLDASQA